MSNIQQGFGLTCTYWSFARLLPVLSLYGVCIVSFALLLNSFCLFLQPFCPRSPSQTTIKMCALCLPIFGLEPCAFSEHMLFAEDEEEVNEGLGLSCCMCLGLVLAKLCCMCFCFCVTAECCSVFGKESLFLKRSLAREKYMHVPFIRLGRAIRCCVWAPA